MQQEGVPAQALNVPMPCIWMQAGVVARKVCHNDYQCISCRFDRALRRAADENRVLRGRGRAPSGKRGQIVSWKERLRGRPPSKRPCLHHMKGRIEFRACNHDYRCGNCEFDQFFNDEYSVHAVIRPVEMSKVKGLRIPQGYYFHEGHTWLRMEEGSTVRVGIDEFALRLLGPLERIEAPLMGKAVAQGRGEIRADRGGRTAMIASPVSGVVTAVNPKLREQGQVAHDDPYSDGWVMSVHAGTLRQDLKHLMIHSETEAFMAAEVERLFQTIEEAGGPLSIDGGQLGTDIYGSMPQLGWDKLVRRFLRT